MTNPGSQALVIPDETRKKYPALIELILGSESMNDEERQYWINILPVMTPDQISSLEDILTTEKNQLEAIDKKYAKEIEAIGTKKLVEKTQIERRKRRMNLAEEESDFRTKEDEKAKALLEEIEK